jgi:hypothetical protein
MTTDVCHTLHHLRREVLVARDRGRVTIEFADGPGAGPTGVDLATARLAADEMLALVNLPRLGRHWWQVERPWAVEVLAVVLHLDLETLRSAAPQREAHALAETILSHFDDRAVLLTNVRPTADLADSPRRWASGRDVVELDAGVAAVSPDLVGLVWVEDRPTAARVT